MSSCKEFVLALEANLHHPAISVEDFQSCSPEPQPLQSIPAFCSVEQPCLQPSSPSAEDPLKSSNMPDLADDPFPPLIPSPRSSKIPVVERACEPSSPAAAQSPPLWSSHFNHKNQMPPPKPKSKLSFIQPEIRESGKVGVCPPLSSAGEIEDLKLSAVGFFMGHRPGFNFVKNALSKQWKTRGAVEFHLLLHGGFLFTFSDAEDRERILESGMFYVGGRPIFVREWERHIHSGAMGLKSLPLWITLPGLPLHLWGDEALSAVCSCLGKPLYADQTTQIKTRRAFARVCIDVSAGEQLEHSIQVEDDEGNLFIQPVSYEWIPPQCLDCKIFGHDIKSCPQRPKIPSPSGGDATISDDNPSKISENLGVKESDNIGEIGFIRPLGKNRRRVRKMKHADSVPGKGDRVFLDPENRGNSNFKFSDPAPQDKVLPSAPEPETVPSVSPLIPQSRFHATSIPTYLNPFDPIANLSEIDGDDPLFSPAGRHPSPSTNQLAVSKSSPLITRSKSRAQRSTSASTIPSPFKPLIPVPSLNPLSISLRPSVTSHTRARLPTLPFSRLAILEPSISPSSNPAPSSCGEPSLVAVHQASPGIQSAVPNVVESENWDSDSESYLSDEWGSLNNEHLAEAGRSVFVGGKKVGSSKTVRVSPILD